MGCRDGGDVRSVGDAFRGGALAPEEHEQQHNAHDQRDDDDHRGNVTVASFVGPQSPHGESNRSVGVTERAWMCADVPIKIPGASPLISTTVTSSPRLIDTVTLSIPAVRRRAVASASAEDGAVPYRATADEAWSAAELASCRSCCQEIA